MPKKATTEEPIEANGVVYKLHLMRRSRCFVFDNQFEVAKFLWRQNQSVQFRLKCIYMSDQPLPIGAFGMGIDATKVTLYV